MGGDNNGGSWVDKHRERPLVKAGQDHLLIRLGLVEVWDPKAGENREEWVAEARWFPAHVARAQSGGRRSTNASKAQVRSDTATGAIEGMARLISTQWPAIWADLNGETVANS